jgi:hypothetical protein
MLRQFGAYLLCIMLCFRLVWQVGYIGYYEYNTETLTNLYCIKKNDAESKCKARCFLIKQIDKFESDNATNGNTRPVKIFKVDLPEFLSIIRQNLPTPGIANFFSAQNSYLKLLTPGIFTWIDTPPPRV